MNRMEKVFGEMREKGEKILILYFPIGDTIFDDSVEWGVKYFKNGATVLEIGLPYEDPALDGKTVRDSMARAIGNVTHDDVFRMIGEIRRRCPDNILQIMTYHGNCLKYGYELFAKKCCDAGVDGVLCPDASEEQLLLMDEALGKYDIHNLRFSLYHLTDEAIEDIKLRAKGYIFQQAVDGATGQQPTVSPQIAVNVKTLKEAGVTTPVCAGFGISDAGQVKEALAFGADGVIVGSALVSHIAAGDGEEFIASLYAASVK